MRRKQLTLTVQRGLAHHLGQLVEPCLGLARGVAFAIGFVCRNHAFHRSDGLADGRLLEGPHTLDLGQDLVIRREILEDPGKLGVGLVVSCMFDQAGVDVDCLADRRAHVPPRRAARIALAGVRLFGVNRERLREPVTRLEKLFAERVRMLECLAVGPYDVQPGLVRLHPRPQLLGCPRLIEFEQGGVRRGAFPQASQSSDGNDAVECVGCLGRRVLNRVEPVEQRFDQQYRKPNAFTGRGVPEEMLEFFNRFIDQLDVAVRVLVERVLEAERIESERERASLSLVALRAFAAS